MPFIGKQPDSGGYQILAAMTASATASYTMQINSTNFEPGSANQLIVSLNGVIQKPGSSFTISGSTLTFSSALTSSDSIDFILVLGDTLDIGIPSDATITSAKLANANLEMPNSLDMNGKELILDIDGDTSITADTDDKIDFAWVDGGHFGEVPITDLRNCGRLNIPHILVDDYFYLQDDVMRSVKMFVSETNYEIISHTDNTLDDRGIVYISNCPKTIEDSKILPFL